MAKENIVRFVILGILWVLVAGYVLTHAVINFFTIFAVAASAVIVFVPLWRKYGKGK